MTTSRPRSRRGSGEELRDALIAATVDLLDTKELDDLSVRTVTGATGVSPTAMYLHFADLAALLHEVKKRFFATLAERLRAAATAEDVHERLRTLAHAYLGYARDHPGHYAVIFHADKRTDAAPDPPEDVVAAGFAAFEPVMAAVREALPDRPQETFEVAVELWLGLHGRAQLSAAMPWFDLPDQDRYVDRLITRIL
ncbi:TetR/AcrR family transcriptional regulator [Actinocrispum wychmicini]|uniref:TetR family transcriptional regulator n=1 Tax=Actinocrispum wychmicini TaxID=1213861 RepID=A0A4R2JYB5_9PSEU|nr:TetR/AcrR family transcriptional regulator [Actinocrispum wychmicini]TCO65601.1 TetR family transcriptional regulator [Actinocrispum wychmicini]